MRLRVRFWALFLWLAIAGPLSWSATVPLICGSYPERVFEELKRSRHRAGERRALRQLDAPAIRNDVGEIALLETSGGIVREVNPFDLNRKVVRFVPADTVATRYRVTLDDAPPQWASIPAGEPVALDDDDSHEVALPFPFPFFGRTYDRVFLNSDGNLTFGESDTAVAARSLGRLIAGPPRAAALFRDLDPSRSGRIVIDRSASAFSATWWRIPEYRDGGGGRQQTFQIRLLPNGTVEYTYDSVTTDAAVTGIAYGENGSSSEVISLDSPPAVEFSGTVAEVFDRLQGLDLVRAAQRFYESHDDSYDYLVIFNDQNLTADDAIAYQLPIRIHGSGYGLPRLDVGREFGSPRRLQSILNMGPLSQYPADPRAPFPQRPGTGDTSLTVLAHEAGHQYLAFVSVPDPQNPFRNPMLGRQQAHWSFFFNSEASVMEGNRIEDRGVGVNPRFLTTAAAQGFSPLDRYLMGLGTAAEVLPTFYVSPSNSSFRPDNAPRPGIGFPGERTSVSIEDVLAIAGRRTPDSTVAQRRFRFAFILVTREGAQPAAAELDKLETLRREFESYFEVATGGRAAADATLRAALTISAFPAVGVIRGSTGSAFVEIEHPAPGEFRVSMHTAKGLARVPETIVIPAGERRASFRIEGVAAGVDTLTAVAERSEYEMALAQIQVEEPEKIRLMIAATGRVIEARVTDENELPYPGVSVSASVIGTSTVAQPGATTDITGLAQFPWAPGLGTVQLSAGAITTSVSGLPQVAAVVNAASFDDRVAPGALASAFGTGFDGQAIHLTAGGLPVEILARTAGQINFLVPANLAPGLTNLVVETERGRSPEYSTTLKRSAPAIFVDPVTGLGAIISGGRIRPFSRGEVVEIYATGISKPPIVRIGEIEAVLQYAGPAPGLLGLWQMNAVIPQGLAGGDQPVTLISPGEQSPIVHVQILP